MRALITGGAGFLGSELYRLLLDFGHDVIVLDDYSTGSIDNLRGVPGKLLNRRWHFKGSVTDPADVGRVMTMAPDVVFHLAAQVDVGASAADPLHDANANVMGTLRMLEASARAEVRRFVFASTAAVFGNADGDVRATERAPIAPYGASKTAAEVYVRLYNRLYNMACTTAVFSNIYGPRQAPGRGAVNIFTRQILAGEPVTLRGDGRNVRDYVYVADAARALAWAAGMLPGQEGEPDGGTDGRRTLLVGTGVATTDRQLLAKVAAEVSLQTGVLTHDRPRAETVPAGPGDIRHSLFPRSELAPTTLDDGLRITVETIRKEMGL